MSQSHFARSDASSAGAGLAAAREELNLTVSDVARHLKLSPAQVEALEEGAYERLPGRVFVRGFLRNYAKLLGVDPQPLLRRIEHEMPQPRAVREPPAAPEAVMPTGEQSRWPLYTGIAATIIVALAAYEFGFNSPPSSGNEGSGKAAAPTESGETPPATVSTAPRETPASGASGTQPYAAATAPAGASTGGVPLNPALSLPSQVDKAGPGERTLVFRFEVEAWVEIRDRSDKVIYSKLNRAGAEERVAGTPPLKLVVGNARGVRLTYDNKPVDLSPHIGVTVARLTLQ